MNQDRVWILLSKKLSGEAIQAEIKELEVLILGHPEWQQAIQNIEDLWGQKAQVSFLEAEESFLFHQQKLREMGIGFDEQQTPQIKSRRKFGRIYQIAAAAAVIISFFFLFKSMVLSEGESKYNRNQNITREVNEITTRAGSKSKIKLPDGSIVWLNAGSKLTYYKDYGKELREIYLSGEGFFDVAKMKDKPFIIHTSSITIKVLGTVFNVKAYPDDRLTETSLISGSIEVTIKNRPNDKIILSPREKLIVQNDFTISKNIEPDSLSAKRQVLAPPLILVDKLRYNPLDSTVAEAEWTNNRLVFRDESFEELAVRLERWYDVIIEIQDENLKKAKLNGIFETETIIQALDALAEMIHFKYEKTGNKILINP
ncbi:MAG: FecR family protein [Bacteroidetes bacterium]|nr:FecR family protein [Bacteroidota bacterium]